MLPPILPSPISPSCTTASPLRGSRLSCPSCPGSAGKAHRHDQVPVAARPRRRCIVAPGEPVEQERRVEADGQRLAVEVDVAALLRLALVVRAAGPQGDLAGGELAAQ